MEMTLTERLFKRLTGLYMDNRAPFLSSLFVGLAAHMFMLTNKLPNHDDIESLFGKGATITSGRWGLELIKPLFPDWSMPWIYGLISILLISVAVCIMVKVLEIKSKPLQIILGALIISFPSLTGTLCFMFTSSAYALAFLFSVLAVYRCRKKTLKDMALACLYIVLCLSIYQAYIAITASLFVLIMLGQALDGEKAVGQILVEGIKALLLMAAALAFYFGITLLVFRLTGAEFNNYVVENVNVSISVFTRIKMAYESFRDIFVFRNFYVISSELSRYFHIALALLILAGAAFICAKAKKPLHALLTLALLVLLPLSINCMYLAMSAASIHSLVLYSFVCFYLLAAMVIERFHVKAATLTGDAMVLIMCAVVLSNVYFANMTYLNMALQLESASSFYTSLITQIKSTEGFDEDCKLAIIGRQDNLLYSSTEFDTELLMGPTHDLINIYSRENFFKRYLGFDMAFASEEECSAIASSAEFEAMPEYPYYGSVAKLGDFLVVKLG